MTTPHVEVLTFGAHRGGPGAPTLVFLHEGLGSAEQWRDFPEIVSADVGLPALAYSRVGYGKSAPVALPRPLTYMQDEARDFLPLLLDEQGIASAILVGHSDGASIAVVAASLDGAAGRGRIAGVVLEAPHVFVEDESIASIEKTRRAYAETDLREKLARYHGDNVDGAFRGWNDAWLDPAFRTWNLEGYLPAITVPVLCLQGEQDPYGTRAQVDAIARQVSGRAEIVMLPGCGHTPHREAFEATRAAIGSFVRGLRAG
ncbi:MAG: benzoate degradation ring-cleavage hydrolase [Labilithrix sp.]|nr:benzoate degradation ring-cleavage hydrolase [Labilithrix sp.]